MRTYNMTMPELTLPSIKSLLYPLSASQNLNGYGKPWVGGAGKNKLPKGTTTTHNGVTFTVNDDGSVTANGKATADAYLDIVPAGTSALAPYLANGTTYTLSGCPSGGSLTTYRQQVLQNGVYSNDTGSGANFTYTTGNTDRVRIFVSNGYTASNLKFYPMIRVSTEPATYEPYENICPIIGETEVDVTRAGKNLFSGDTVSLEKPSTRTKAMNIERIPAGTYVISWEYSGTSTDTQVCFRKASGVQADQRQVALTQSSPVTVTFTVDMSAVYYFIATSQTDGVTAEISKMMIRKVGTSDSYEPYEGDTYITDLGQTVYGGTLDITSGLLTINMARTTVGDLSWSYSTNYSYHYASLQQGRSQEVASVISSGYESKGVNGSNSAMASAPNGTIWKRFNGGMQQDATHVYIKDTAYTTPSDFKTARSSVEIVYELATPITVQLTPTQVETLAGSNTVMADKTITLTFNGQTLTGQAVTFEAEGRRVVYMFMPTV